MCRFDNQTLEWTGSFVHPQTEAGSPADRLQLYSFYITQYEDIGERAQ